MTAPRIMLLDNDPAALTLLHDLLIDQGYRTLRCRPDDVISAHALVKRARPPLVILDLWREPRENSWTFLAYLWGDSETAHVSVLILTETSALPTVQTALLYAKRCTVVQKPFDPQNMLDAIAAVLGPTPAEWDHDRRLQAAPDADASAPARPDAPLVAAAGEDE